MLVYRLNNVSKTFGGRAIPDRLELIDSVKVSRPTRHKTGHFGDVIPRNSWLKNKIKHNRSKHAMHP